MTSVSIRRLLGELYIPEDIIVIIPQEVSGVLGECTHHIGSYCGRAISEKTKVSEEQARDVAEGRVNAAGGPELAV